MMTSADHLHGLAELRAEERLLECLLPPAPRDSFEGHDSDHAEYVARRQRTVEKFRKLLRDGKLEDREVEIVREDAGELADYLTPTLFDSAMRIEIRRMLNRVDGAAMAELEAALRSHLPTKPRRVRVTVTEARQYLLQDEYKALQSTQLLIGSETTLAVPEPGRLVVVQASLLELLRTHPELLHQISHRQFEELVYELFAGLGYEVELTAQTRDGGADLIAFSQDHLGIRTKYVVEAKHYAPERKIGVGIVRQVSSVRQKLGAHHGIIVTSSTFTADAVKENRDYYGLHLKDHNHLMDWIKQR